MTLLPLLTAVSVTAQAVTFTSTMPGQPPQTLTLPRPLALALQLRGELLTVTAGGVPLPAWAYRVERATAAGQELLIVLGFAGPYPVPAGVSLGGAVHGQALSEVEALRLAGLPGAECWALCPVSAGRLTLLWGNAATAQQLAASTDWATGTAASIQASRSPSGSA